MVQELRSLYFSDTSLLQNFSEELKNFRYLKIRDAPRYRTVQKLFADQGLNVLDPARPSKWEHKLGIFGEGCTEYELVKNWEIGLTRAKWHMTKIPKRGRDIIVLSNNINFPVGIWFFEVKSAATEDSLRSQIYSLKKHIINYKDDERKLRRCQEIELILKENTEFSNTLDRYINENKSQIYAVSLVTDQIFDRNRFITEISQIEENVPKGAILLTPETIFLEEMVNNYFE